MSVKVILTWNIRQGREQEYFGFVVGEYLPQLNRLGLELTDAWATIYGDDPQILVGALMPDLEHARTMMNSETWHTLNAQLEEYVSDFKVKVVNPKGAFQF